MHPLRVTGIVFLLIAAGFILTSIIYPIVVSKRIENAFQPTWNNDFTAIPTISRNLDREDYNFNLNKGSWVVYRYDVAKGTDADALVIGFDSNSNPYGEADTFVNFGVSRNEVQTFRNLTWTIDRNNRNFTWTVCEGSNYMSLYYNGSSPLATFTLPAHLQSNKEKIFLNFCNAGKVIGGLLGGLSAAVLGVIIGGPGLCCLVGGLCCVACAPTQHNHYHTIQTTDNTHYHSNYPPQPAYGQPAYAQPAYGQPGYGTAPAKVV